MTYKKIRKIQVYILILLTILIFNENIQIILKTRNILKTDKKVAEKIIFLPKIKETETKPKLNLALIQFRSSREAFGGFLENYIKDKHKQSFSRIANAIDKLFFWGKGLIFQLFKLLKREVVSVKYRYLLGSKWLENKREVFLKRLEGVISPRGVPLAKGLLFGDLSSIDQETYHSFKVIGILHILSASSANFTIFLHFLLLFCKPFVSFLSKKAVFGLYFSIILLYLSLVGGSPSTLRAFFSLVFSFYAYFSLERAYLSVFGLGVIAILMLFINPFYLDSLGFQLSFLASFGIIFMYRFLEKDLYKGKNYLVSSILLTFCAQFFLIPILIFRFGELNFISILANLLVSPLAELLTVLFLASFTSLFASSILPVTFFEQFLSLLISKTMDILFIFIDFLEKIPYKSFIFKDRKELFTAIFCLINFAVIVVILRFKKNKYLKNKYRVISL